MIKCSDLVEIRKKCFEERSLYSPFRNVDPEVIFDFLREIGVFYKIRSVVKYMFVWDVLKESCSEFLCEMFNNLFNE